MDENEAQNVIQGLSMLADWLDEDGLRERIGKVRFYEQLADKLNALAGKSWSWRYVQGVLAGSVGPSADFARAVAALGATIDDAPAAAAYTVQVTVLARPGAVPPGSLVLAEARPCQWPGGCRVWFVPRSGNQRYCDRSLHEAAERERKRRSGSE